MKEELRRKSFRIRTPLWRFHWRLRSRGGRRSSLEPFAIPRLLWGLIAVVSLALTLGFYQGLITIAYRSGKADLDKPFALSTGGREQASTQATDQRYAQFTEQYL